jgi:hypothetical protein
VIVLERIAAVVNRPQEKDLSGFLKKKRLNVSGDLAFNKFDINRRKIRIEEKSNTSENEIRKKTLEMWSKRNRIRGANPIQKCEIVFSTGLSTGVKNTFAIHAETDDRKP